MTINKLDMETQRAMRAELYKNALSGLLENYTTEAVSDGVLLKDNNGNYFKLKISYCLPEKLDLDKERQKFAEKQERKIKVIKEFTE